VAEQEYKHMEKRRNNFSWHKAGCSGGGVFRESFTCGCYVSLPAVKQMMSSGQLAIQGVLLLPPGLPRVPCFNLTKPVSRPMQGFSSENSG